MDFNTYTPGTVVSIRYPMYKHFAIISDRVSNNMPMLLSLSYRRNGIKEESWSTVVGGRPIERSNIQGTYPMDIVVQRARSCIDKDIKYALFNFNCEHFVRYVHGLPVESIQVKRAVYGAIFGAASCLLLPKLTIVRLAIFATTGAAASLKNSLHKI